MEVGDKIFVMAHKGERIGEVLVVGETRISWLISDHYIKPEYVTPDHWAVTKVNKKELAAGSLYSYKATRQEVEDFLWVQENAWKIGSFVHGVQDVKVLRQVADLIGYVPK